MGHYAKVENGVVTEVLVMEPENLDQYLDNSLYHQLNPGQWVQVSYNTHGGVHYDPETKEPSSDQTKALRGNYPAKGFVYDEDLDAFYAPKPYPSWNLNKTKYEWEPPIPYPDDGDLENRYQWNEETQSWDQVTES